jgi:salicylate hydroxylase
MPGTGKTFYIAGAGISGLTLALALAKFGANVIVLERSPVLSEFGAGLQISPNARLILDRLGLDEALTSHSLEPAGIDVYSFKRTRPLVTLELGAIMQERFGSPYAVMHRADLADLLYKAIRRFANIDILFGVRGWDAVSHERGVTMSIDEADGQTRTGRANALIGADGVHSFTRRNLLNGPDARFGGRLAWRALLPFDSLIGHIALDRVSVLFAPSLHLVCYPLPHRRQVNIALFARGSADTSSKRPNLPRPVQGSARISAILSAAGENWTSWPLYTVSTSVWHKGNIGLVGDAAHAMVPFQAQGAAMGIEDAAVMAPLLVRHDNAELAFSQFQQIRQRRVRRVAHLSETNGRIFHMAWPFSVARNLAIAMQGSRGHLSRLSWLYGFDAGLIPD